MNELQASVYSSALPDEKCFPLSRYLPPYYPGMALRLLKREAAQATPILDPIGASPRTALELAAEFPLVVNCSNPILAFLMTFLAKAPPQSAFQAALADLSILKRGNERIEEHLRSLYLTRCAACRQEVQAEYYLYRRGEASPYARFYRCPACGDAGQKPVSTDDLERLVALQRSYPMHRSRALDRAITGSDDSLKLVNEVLNLYPPRALYFIFTLLNKVEGMKLDAADEEVIDALLISILDAGHVLNPWPESGETPRSLAQPEESVERNLWLVMEQAAAEWLRAAMPVNLMQGHAVPQIAGLAIHRGRMRELAQNINIPSPGAIFSVVPRPYAAFWTFSAVWSAWLWGKEKAAGFMSILERRRFDWNWHSLALQSAFAAAGKLCRPQAPVITILPEPSSGLTSAVFNAASASNWQLRGVAAAGDQQPFQCLWNSGASAVTPTKANTQRIIRDAIRQLLMSSGEPQPYTMLHAAILAALTSHNCLPADLAQLRGDLPAQLNKEIAAIFADSKFLRHLETPSADLESGSWWLAQLEDLPESLSDRVEAAFVSLLQQKPGLTCIEALDELCSRFTGFLSPPDGLVYSLLRSYAKQDATSSKWQRNDHDLAVKRAEDVALIQRLLRETGAKLGYEVNGENPLEWIEPGKGGTTAYRLFTASTACIGQLARLAPIEGCQYVYLFPGSRALLIKERVDRNPLLQQITAGNWHFLKFRTLRHLTVRSDLSRELWALLIDSDPISPEETTQLSMFTL